MDLSETPTASPSPSLLAGRYQLLDRLGAGGMGAVYLARDTKLDRNVAVKVLGDGPLADSVAARFAREAKALARLSHPNIVKAFDHGEDGGRPFLVMEHVEGQSLTALLREHGRLAPSRAADYAYQAALALRHAHQQGLIHRDVKPSNLLLTPDGHVKLLDLGLARFTESNGDPSLTRAGAGMGTPNYAAPEQFWDARKADARSDVYALGCTLYHLLAGRVPFHGPAEDLPQAHERDEAPPLEEQCPEAPAGLAAVVRKMMAKRPADRFGSMADVADALAPFVAGSSAAFAEMRTRSDWQRAVPTVTELRTRSRRRAVGTGLGGLLLGAAVAAAVVPAFYPAPASNPVDDGGDAKLAGGPAPAPGPGPEAPKEEPPTDLLTVSQKPEGGGKYRTIQEALEAVKPAQTVRVLDDAVYRETITLSDPEKFTGITLETVRGATLAPPPDVGKDPKAVSIVGVPGVTVRGFKLRDWPDRSVGVVVRKGSPGVRIQAMDIRLPVTLEIKNGGCVLLEHLEIPKGADPVLVLDCLLVGGTGGVLSRTGTGTSSGGVRVRDNLIQKATVGVQVLGETVDVQVAGNRILDCQRGISLESMSRNSRDVIVANNTVVGCSTGFALADAAPLGANVRVRNNLFLSGKGPDWLFVEWGGESGGVEKLGDGSRVGKVFRLGHNWREGKPADGVVAKAWIPPGPKDKLAEKIEGIGREPDKPDFLRPAKGSDLATKGAGTEDPSLPWWVGALPPEGAEPWDWDRSWRLPATAKLLTVSKEDKGGGKYRTIADALKDAKPWDTVRVLDAATYPLPITLDNKDRHEGLTLEAVNGATLRLEWGVKTGIAVRDVPEVRILGFRLEDRPVIVDDPFRQFFAATGRVPGLTLRRLTVVSNNPLVGMSLRDVRAEPGEPPIRIEACEFAPKAAVSNDAIVIGGTTGLAGARGILVRDCRITKANRGIMLQGLVRDVEVAGNVVHHCRAANLQLEDLAAESNGILFANNTSFGGSPLRVLDQKTGIRRREKQVELVNNLLFQADTGDAVTMKLLDGPQGQLPGDGEELVKLWTWRNNRRDLSGSEASYVIPKAERDSRLTPTELEDGWQESGLPRPRKDSPAAVGGAGPADPSFPTYVGAVPPDGTPSWDWDRTWQARTPAKPK